jgi:hypothetical protein
MCAWGRLAAIAAARRRLIRIVVADLAVVLYLPKKGYDGGRVCSWSPSRTLCPDVCCFGGGTEPIVESPRPAIKSGEETDQTHENYCSSSPGPVFGNAPRQSSPLVVLNKTRDKFCPNDV